MTRLRNLCMTVLFAAGSFLILSFETGCASSSAVKASVDRQRKLSFSEVQQAAEDLAGDLMTSAAFVEARKDALGRGELVVIFLNDWNDRSNDRSGNLTRMVPELFDSIAAEFVNNRIGEFRQDVDPSLPNYVANLDELDKQDFDDRFDQSTGTVTTGGAAKAVMAMQIDVNRDEMAAVGGGGKDYTYILRVKITDGVRKTLVYSGKVVLDKNKR